MKFKLSNFVRRRQHSPGDFASQLQIPLPFDSSQRISIRAGRYGCVDVVSAGTSGCSCWGRSTSNSSGESTNTGASAVLDWSNFRMVSGILLSGCTTGRAALCWARRVLSSAKLSIFRGIDTLISYLYDKVSGRPLSCLPKTGYNNVIWASGSNNAIIGKQLRWKIILEQIIPNYQAGSIQTFTGPMFEPIPGPTPSLVIRSLSPSDILLYSK